jgi:hypothetical protein
MGTPKRRVIYITFPKAEKLRMRNVIPHSIIENNPHIISFTYEENMVMFDCEDNSIYIFLRLYPGGKVYKFWLDTCKYHDTPPIGDVIDDLNANVWDIFYQSGPIIVAYEDKEEGDLYILPFTQALQRMKEEKGGAIRIARGEKDCQKFIAYISYELIQNIEKLGLSPEELLQHFKAFPDITHTISRAYIVDEHTICSDSQSIPEDAYIVEFLTPQGWVDTYVKEGDRWFSVQENKYVNQIN